MEHVALKKAVHDYWNKASCGTEFIHAPKFTRHYFDEIERFRYTIEPEIFSFAQFTRWHGKKVLEVGVGAGTDFIQWVRAGALASGIDLTPEAVAHVQHRLKMYSLAADDIRVADAEHLPHHDAHFDLVYSWGVIHHSPDMEQCLRELIRVAKPGGTIKVMVYNRHSLFAFYRYFLSAFLKGKIFTTFTKVLFQDQESLGTKAYTRAEMQTMLAAYPVNVTKITCPATSHDLLYYKNSFMQALATLLASVLGWNRIGWFMMIEMTKK